MKIAATKWSAAPLPSSPSPPENSLFQMKREKRRGNYPNEDKRG